MSSDTIQKSARLVTTELIRNPVKDAVHEALHDESITVRRATDDESTSDEQRSDERKRSDTSSTADQEHDESGRPWLALAGVIAAVAGIAFLARRRMSSTSGSAWSESTADVTADEPTSSDYVSEGDMHTTGKAGDSDSTTV